MSATSASPATPAEARPQTMRAAQLGLRGLKVGRAKCPQPGPNDVLVKVAASSVNPKDWKLNRNLARLVGPLGQRWTGPLFGDDLAGEVVAAGCKVANLAVGDRVFGMDMRLRTNALAEYAIIHAHRVAKMPPNVSFRDAAGMPLAGQTALQGLRQGGAKAGSEVLLIGASGGVGTYAVQIAKALSCDVTAVCSGRNRALVEELGADQIIDYTSGDYRASAGRFDLVFDITSYETPRSCATLLKPDGQFVSTMGNARAATSTWLARRASLVTVESTTADLEQLGNWMASGRLHTVIDSVYPLADAKQAYARSQSGRARGKIIIEIDPAAVSAG